MTHAELYITLNDFYCRPLATCRKKQFKDT